MILSIFAIGIPLILALGGAIYSFGRLTQTVSDLKTKIDHISTLEDKVDNLAERMSALEAVIEERREAGYG